MKLTEYGENATKMGEILKQTTNLAVLAEQPITDQISYEFVCSLLKDAKSLIKMVDAIYDPLIKSGKEHVKMVQKERDMRAQPIEATDTLLRVMTAEWATKQEHDRQEKEAFLREAGAEVAVVEEKVAGIAYRDVWKWEFDASGEIPRKYLIPNEVMISAIVRAQKDLTSIPGIKVFCEKITVVR